MSLEVKLLLYGYCNVTVMGNGLDTVMGFSCP